MNLRVRRHRRSSGSAAPAPSPPYRYYTLAMLTAVYTLNLVDRHLMLLLIQPIKEDLHSILYLIERFERYGLLAPLPSAFNSVLRLPNTMPWRMACNMAERFGMPPWNDKQKAIGREHYIATRTEEERAMDEAMGYPDL